MRSCHSSTQTGYLTSMASGGSRPAHDKVASPDDDIDSGWDDVPESSSIPVKAQSTLAPASTVPKPSASGFLPKASVSQPPASSPPKSLTLTPTPTPTPAPVSVLPPPVAVT